MSEHQIVNRLEVAYQNRNIHRALVVIGADSDVDTDRLERMLMAKNFPLHHSLFITWECDLRDDRDDWIPDLVVVKTSDVNVIDRVLKLTRNENGIVVFT